MTIPTPLWMMGAPGSPYTRKMRALMRYRHIPYRMIQQGGPQHAARPKPKVELLPTFYLPDESGNEVAVTDSTPLIRRFEKEFAGRNAVPTDPVIGFLDALLEDFADEWLTKPMFHYRWYYQADVDKAASILPLWRQVNVSDEDVKPFCDFIAKRQIDRLWVVGSNDTTAPVIEGSYKRILKLFDAHLQTQPFLMGNRPGSSDFAFLGQLTCLVLFDPTPAAIALAEAPRVYAWVEGAEELSGLEPTEDDWIKSDAVPETIKALLCEVGRVYTPFLLANAEAIQKGAERVETTIEDLPWTQKPFPYQAKCLRWLREHHAALSADDRAKVDAILAGTGCEALFA
ncbi:MAG: glutathione S-transferase N-terminal domain-containing protein [Candidatus Binatia bacterium]|nr:glutathione S-transferase N-terminal domain-containing protein [Candidatus Binatia bacterium]